MVRLTVMVGLPASGKSTKAAELSNGKVLSSDAYRKAMYGNECDQEHNDKVFKALYQDMRDILSQGIDCVFDATNTTLKSRRRIFENIKNISRVEVTAYVMTTPFTVCCARDARRGRSVGTEVISRFLKSYQFPQKFEGFNNIIVDGYTKCPYPDPNQLYELLEDMLDFDQQNPHHAFTLGTHSILLSNNYKAGDPRHSAGLLHDVGKRFTASFDSKGIAHYYGHDSIGTYWLLDKLNILNLDSWEDIFECLFYINYHMRGHKDFTGEKAEKKYRAIFGDQLYNNLIEFAEFDKQASGTYDTYNKETS